MKLHTFTVVDVLGNEHQVDAHVVESNGNVVSFFTGDTPEQLALTSLFVSPASVKRWLEDA